MLAAFAIGRGDLGHAAALLGQSLALRETIGEWLGMVEGVWEMMPSAEVWHIGLYRDERTLRPVEYYNKLPVIYRQVCIILDPMLATGARPWRR
jgi:uracil phosphoribosyltransferase